MIKFIYTLIIFCNCFVSCFSFNENKIIKVNRAELIDNIKFSVVNISTINKKKNIKKKNILGMKFNIHIRKKKKNFYRVRFFNR